MRILLTHVYSWPEVRRGGERYLHELGAALVGSGHTVQIVSSAPSPTTDVVLDVPVQRLRRRQRLRRYGEIGPEMLFGLEVLARHAIDRFDVWHALGTSDAAAASLLSSVRRWPRIRSVYTDLGGSDRPYRQSRPDNRLFDYVVDHVDSYVCLSSTMRDRLVESYGRPGLVVGGGVDLRRFRPATDRAAEPTLLYSGALAEPRKNLALLVEAFDRVLDEWPTARLVLSGPGDANASVARATSRARAATDVIGLGRIDDLAQMYRKAWATVLPSTDEAFGLVLVESLACGTPIVALAGGGGPAELVNPKVGALAGAETPEALAAACIAALRLASQGSATSDACRAAAERFGWRESIVPTFERIYSGDLVEERRSGEQ